MWKLYPAVIQFLILLCMETLILRGIGGALVLATVLLLPAAEERGPWPTSSLYRDGRLIRARPLPSKGLFTGEREMVVGSCRCSICLDSDMQVLMH